MSATGVAIRRVGLAAIASSPESAAASIGALPPSSPGSVSTTVPPLPVAPALALAPLDPESPSPPHPASPLNASAQAVTRDHLTASMDADPTVRSPRAERFRSEKFQKSGSWGRLVFRSRFSDT